MKNEYSCVVNISMSLLYSRLVQRTHIQLQRYSTCVSSVSKPMQLCTVALKHVNVQFIILLSITAFTILQQYFNLAYLEPFPIGKISRLKLLPKIRFISPLAQEIESPNATGDQLNFCSKLTFFPLFL
jgi:hypothetical protein